MSDSIVTKLEKPLLIPATLASPNLDRTQALQHADFSDLISQGYSALRAAAQELVIDSPKNQANKTFVERELTPLVYRMILSIDRIQECFSVLRDGDSIVRRGVTSTTGDLERTTNQIIQDRLLPYARRDLEQSREGLRVDSNQLSDLLASGRLTAFLGGAGVSQLQNDVAELLEVISDQPDSVALPVDGRGDASLRLDRLLNNLRSVEDLCSKHVVRFEKEELAELANHRAMSLDEAVETLELARIAAQNSVMQTGAGSLVRYASLLVEADAAQPGPDRDNRVDAASRELAKLAMDLSVTQVERFLVAATGTFVAPEMAGRIIQNFKAEQVEQQELKKVLRDGFVTAETGISALGAIRSRAELSRIVAEFTDRGHDEKVVKALCRENPGLLINAEERKGLLGAIDSFARDCPEALEYAQYRVGVVPQNFTTIAEVAVNGEEYALYCRIGFGKKILALEDLYIKTVISLGESERFEDPLLLADILVYGMVGLTAIRAPGEGLQAKEIALSMYCQSPGFESVAGQIEGGLSRLVKAGILTRTLDHFSLSTDIGSVSNPSLARALTDLLAEASKHSPHRSYEYPVGVKQWDAERMNIASEESHFTLAAIFAKAYFEQPEKRQSISDWYTLCTPTVDYIVTRAAQYGISEQFAKSSPRQLAADLNDAFNSGERPEWLGDFVAISLKVVRREMEKSLETLQLLEQDVLAIEDVQLLSEQLGDLRRRIDQRREALTNSLASEDPLAFAKLISANQDTRRGSLVKLDVYLNLIRPALAVEAESGLNNGLPNFETVLTATRELATQIGMVMNAKEVRKFGQQLSSFSAEHKSWGLYRADMLAMVSMFAAINSTEPCYIYRAQILPGYAGDFDKIGEAHYRKLSPATAVLLRSGNQVELETVRRAIYFKWVGAMEKRLQGVYKSIDVFADGCSIVEELLERTSVSEVARPGIDFMKGCLRPLFDIARVYRDDEPSPAKVDDVVRSHDLLPYSTKRNAAWVIDLLVQEIERQRHA